MKRNLQEIAPNSEVTVQFELMTLATDLIENEYSEIGQSLHSAGVDQSFSFGWWAIFYAKNTQGDKVQRHVAEIVRAIIEEDSAESISGRINYIRRKLLKTITE